MGHSPNHPTTPTRYPIPMTNIKLPVSANYIGPGYSCVLDASGNQIAYGHGAHIDAIVAALNEHADMKEALALSESVVCELSAQLAGSYAIAKVPAAKKEGV